MSSTLLRTSLLLLALSVSASCQKSNPPQQAPMLTDPTPRPPDLEKQYGTDPLASQKQLAAQRAGNLAHHRQALALAAKMAQLSSALARDVSAQTQGPAPTGPTVPDVIKATQIEKLAHDLQDSLKPQ